MDYLTNKTTDTHIEDWKSLDIPPTPTINEQDFLEGMKFRREWIVKNNPYTKILRGEN